MSPVSKHKMVCTKCVQVQIFLGGMWPLVWLFFYFMSAVRFFGTKALPVMFHSERPRPKKKPSLDISITCTHDDIQDGLFLCVCLCVWVRPCPRRILYPSAILKRLYSISRTSSSCHYLFYPRSRQSHGKRREGLPAVMLQAKIFVTRSPVAVPSSISQSLSFPLQLPSLSPSRASAHGCCSKR